MYRFRLGKKTVGDNLITNGGFEVNMANWNCGGVGCPANGWARANVGGHWAAQYTGGCGDLLAQGAIFTAGTYYRISYEIFSVGLEGSIGLYVGDFGKEYDVASNLVWTAITKDRVCLQGIDIAFKPLSPGASVNIDNITVYELDWNEPLENEPIGWGDSKINVKRDKDMKGLFKKYITELTFKGDGYDYLKAQYEDSICNEVPILIEYQCSEGDDWTEVYEGVIYVADITWDLVRCQAFTEIDDMSASALIVNGKNVKVFFAPSYGCGGGADILTDAVQVTDFHNMTTGLYRQGDKRDGAHAYNVGLLFRRIIHNATDVKVEFESDLFEIGTYKYFAIGIGEDWGQGVPGIGENSMISFKELFDEMDKIFNISFQIYYPAGIPTIKIEEVPDFYNAGVLLTLNNVPNLEYKLDKSILYRTVDIGYKKFYDTVNSRPSDYDEGFHYEIEGTCFDLHLDLVCKYIQDSFAIDIMFPPPSLPDYYSDYFVVECYDNAGTIETRQFNIGGVFYFNQNINQDDNMLRWIWSMPSHAILQTDTTTTIGKINVPLLLTWDFKFPISWAELNTVLADTTQQIRFGSEADNIEDRDGYIDELTFEVKSGRTTFKLITT